MSDVIKYYIILCLALLIERTDCHMANDLNKTNHNFISFPEDFLWGCATSPTQVEGETVNEWSGKTAGDGSNPDDGSNHWRRYRYDFRCLSSMNLNSYRFGFDWARLQPRPCEPLERDIKLRYLEMLAELRSYGIEPMLTLFHHASPKWFADMGGWLNPESPKIFADFVRRVAIFTDGEVQNWIPLNEPVCYAFLTYIAGIFPPHKKGRFNLYYKALSNMKKAYAQCYREIKNHIPTSKVGISNLLKNIKPTRSWHPVDQASALFFSQYFKPEIFNQFIYQDNENLADFLGINYHGKIRTYGSKALSPLYLPKNILSKYNAQCDDMWEQDPDGLLTCLNKIDKLYKIPLYISGHAVATEDEGLRVRMLKEHLINCSKAINNGVDLRGYFYWSLLDTFDWSEGLKQQFGLVAVAFEDPDRRRDIRRTGCIFGEFAKRNGFMP